MKSSQKLSFKFEANSMLQDLESVDSEWTAHMNVSNYEGDWSGLVLREPVNKLHPLAAVGNSNEYKDTAFLKNCNYFSHILDYFKCNKTSVRLLKLASGSIIKAHKDRDLDFFENHVRLHVPIITHPKVEFIVDGTRLFMQPGECWFADFSQTHSVKNLSQIDRIHLVIDLEVNEWLKKLFVKERIIEQNEKAPNPMDQFDDETKIQILAALRAQNNEHAQQLADELMKKYKLNLYHES